MSLIKSLDFFGENIQLSLNNKNSGQTLLGGILFLISITLVALSSWFIGKDIYFKKHPINNQQTMVSKIYPEVNLNSSTFPIAVSLQDLNGIYLEDDRFLQVKMKYYEYKTLENGSFVMANASEVKLALCKYEDFPTLDKLFFNNLRLDHFLCPQQNINLYGYWSELSLAYLNIGIFACDYDLQPDYCAKKEEIDNYISSNSINVNLGILDNVISFDNYEDPLTPFLSVPYKFLTKEMKISNILIQQNQIFTDGGFIFEDYSSVNYLKAFTLFDDSAIYDESLKQYARLQIYSSNQSTITYRRYIKIPDILAFVGGILKLVNLFFYYVNLKFSQISKCRTVIDNLFDINNEKNLNDSFKLNKKEIGFKILNNRLVLKKNNEMAKETTNLSQPDEKKGTLKFTIFDYFQIICNRKKKSKQKPNVMIYYKAEKEILHYFDLLIIIKNILEFQYLKKIMLTKEDQEKLHSHKPSITLNEDKLNEDSCVKELHFYKTLNLNISQSISPELKPKI
jgi:hypothetical protein